MYTELLKMLINLNIILHRDEKLFKYHIKHCYLMEKFMKIISYKNMFFDFNERTLAIIAWSHDLLKDRENKFSDLYRKNKNNILRFHLTEDMREAINDHAYRSAEFLSSYPYNILDGEILYSVLFHSIPIIEIMTNHLRESTRNYVELAMLCDKLSSNYLRIHDSIPVAVDLNNIVFGENFNELNFSKGLYYARLFDELNNKNKYHTESTEYYRKRWSSNHFVILKEPKLWEKRKNPLLETLSNISTTLLIDANLQDCIISMMSSSEKERIIHHV